VQEQLPLKLQKISMPNIQLVVGEHKIVISSDVCGVSIIHKPYPLPTPTEVFPDYLGVRLPELGRQLVELVLTTYPCKLLWEYRGAPVLLRLGLVREPDVLL
jgi:hypothetical protein